MKPKYVLYGSIPLLLLILGIMYPISGFEDLASILVAWGTLMLAIATFSLVWQTIEYEKSRKQDELNRENRLRKERWLDDILNWISKIKMPSIGGGIIFTTLKHKDLFSSFGILLGDMISRSEYIKHISDVLDKNLSTSVNNAISKLENCEKAANDLVILLDDATVPEAKFKHFVKCKIDAEESANEVIQIASKLKISLLS